MASEAYKKPSREGVGLLLLNKGKEEPDGDERAEGGMSDEDYRKAKADGAKAFFEAASGGDWDTAGEELAKVIHLCMDE